MEARVALVDQRFTCEGLEFLQAPAEKGRSSWIGFDHAAVGRADECCIHAAQEEGAVALVLRPHQRAVLHGGGDIARNAIIGDGAPLLIADDRTAVLRMQNSAIFADPADDIAQLIYRILAGCKPCQQCAIIGVNELHAELRVGVMFFGGIPDEFGDGGTYIIETAFGQEAIAIDDVMGCGEDGSQHCFPVGEGRMQVTAFEGLTELCTDLIDERAFFIEKRSLMGSRALFQVSHGERSTRPLARSYNAALLPWRLPVVGRGIAPVADRQAGARYLGILIGGWQPINDGLRQRVA